MPTARTQTGSRRSSQAASTRETLLAEGLRSFGERGYTASRLADIVEASSLTTGAFYRHFASKAEFFGALCAAYEEDLQASLGAAETLKGKFEVWLRVARKHRGVARGMMELGDAGGQEAAGRQRLRDTCASLLMPHLLELAEWRDARTAALVLVDMLDQYVLMEAAGWTPERSPRSIAAQLNRLVTSGLYKS